MSYNPTPKPKYLAVVITNNTSLPDTEVYVLYMGKYKDAGGNLFFFELNAQTNPSYGVYFPVLPTSTTFSANYSYQLSSLPRSSTGANDYLVYVPDSPSNRFYFSIGKPMYLQSDANPNNIAPPTYYAFYDPNYYNLFETIEVSFLPEGGSGGQYIDWTGGPNTTEVDAFCFPLKINYRSWDPANPSIATELVQNPNALPSGFGVGGTAGETTRAGILTYVTGKLASDDLTTHAIWPRLAVPFCTNPYDISTLTTYLRVLSPKQSVGNDPAPSTTGGITSQHLPAVIPGPTQLKTYNYPPFPMDYVSSTGYGDAKSFANNVLFAYHTPHELYINTGGAAGTTYKCITTGTSPNQILTCTGISGPNTGQVSTLSESAINTNKIYSGSQLFSGGPDADNLGFYFGDAFTVGFLGGAIGTSTDPFYPIKITDAVTWQPHYIPLYYTHQYSAFGGGPWRDLYAHSLHDCAVRNTVTGDLNGVGLCYGYDFDDSLGVSGDLALSSLTLKQLYPYFNITLGEIDTSVPDIYSDASTYDVTFNFAAGRTLEVSYNGGAYAGVSSGVAINGVKSNDTDKLLIHYTNAQGPTNDHFFVIYLKYQLMVPTVVYNGTEKALIDSTTITPNSATPTAFTIALLP